MGAGTGTRHALSFLLHPRAWTSKQRLIKKKSVMSVVLFCLLMHVPLRLEAMIKILTCLRPWWSQDAPGAPRALDAVQLSSNPENEVRAFRRAGLVFWRLVWVLARSSATGLSGSVCRMSVLGLKQRTEFQL